MADTAVTQEQLVSSTTSDGHASGDDHCSKQRHWYAFLCSSLITFLACLFLVLLGRIVAWLCCGGVLGGCFGGDAARRKLESATEDGVVGAAQRSKTAVAAPSGNIANGGERRKSDVDGGVDALEIGWATEAKDWAGELISGQTTTGRIMVSIIHECALTSTI